MPPINPTRLESVHFMVLPAPKFWNSPSQLNFQINFSGVAVIDNFKGNADGSWRNDTLEINAAAMRMDKIMERVSSSLPPLQPNELYAFIPLQWTIYASVNSQFDAGSSENAGFGAYNFGIRRNPDILSGMFVAIQVRDKDAWIYRVGYSMNVYGYFRKIDAIT
jgi:hypothetical protein